MKILLLLILSFSSLYGRPWRNWIEKSAPIEWSKPEITVTNVGGRPAYTLPDRKIPLYSMKFVFQGGEYEEPKDKVGITRLWSEMLVSTGSIKSPKEQLSKLLDTRATKFAVSNSFERVMFSLSGLTKNLDQDLDLVLEVMANPNWDESNFELLKNQFLKDIEKISESPVRYAYRTLEGFLSTENANNVRSKLPTKKTVESISLKDINEWHKQIFIKNRLELLVSGDFESTTWFDRLDPFVSSLKLGDVIDDSVLEEEVKYPKGIWVHQKLNLHQSVVLAVSKGVRYSHSDYVKIDLLDFILGGGLGSYLFQKIRTENGWAYTARSEVESNKYVGRQFIFTQTRNENLTQVLNLIEKILSSPEKYLTEQKISDAKLATLNNFVFLTENSDNYLFLSAKLRWMGVPEDYLDNYLNLVNSIKRQDLLEIAHKIYSPQNWSGVIVGPDHPKGINWIKGWRKAPILDLK